MRTAARKLRGLHVLADDDPRWAWDPVEQADAACRGGAAVVQLRAKHGGDRDALRWGRAIRRRTRESGVLFVMNDRFDLALLCEADGVHLGQEDVPPERIPSDLRRNLLIGRSTHTSTQAEEAVGEGVDYVAFGPVFGTASKQTPWDARGLQALEEIAARVEPLPVVAIGGIDAARAARAREAGASAVAVISAVAGARDPVGAARHLVASLADPAG